MVQFSINNIVQEVYGVKRTWTIPELLETYEPLGGEPLAERNEVMKRILPSAEEQFSQLSETARLRYEFWKQLRTTRIEERSYRYSVTISDTYRWELTINPSGLFYKDLTPMYGQQAGQVHEQLFSDFWFYGPLMPVPDLETRQQLVANIRNAFLQVGPVSQQHFPLFEYPALPIDRFWEEGDHNRKDFVNLRPFGIEFGAQNWHDGLMYLVFVPFERLLADAKALEKWISPGIQSEILQHLSVKGSSPLRQQSEEKNPESKRIFMENGGMHHYIMRDYADTYKPGPGDEERWRKELVADYSERLKTEDKREVLYHLATALRYSGVANLEALLLEAAKGPNLKARQAIGQVLAELFNSDAGAEVTLSLLEFEQESDYWRNYVFSALGNMRDNKAVQRFVLQCLQGDHEIHFKKAVDLLALWGMKGDKALMDRHLLLSLNWQDACAADPDFTRSLEKVTKIIQG